MGFQNREYVFVWIVHYFNPRIGKRMFHRTKLGPFKSKRIIYSEEHQFINSFVFRRPEHVFCNPSNKLYLLNIIDKWHFWILFFPQPSTTWLYTFNFLNYTTKILAPLVLRIVLKLKLSFENSLFNILHLLLFSVYQFFCNCTDYLLG